MKLFKNIKYIGFFSGLLIFISSCENYIEEDIFSDVTSENFINEDTADQLIVGIYATLRNVVTNRDFQYLGTDIFTRQEQVTFTSPQNDYFNLTSGEGYAFWSRNYNVIAKANTAINRYENQISWSDSRLDEKANGIAQAQALRAFAYFNLAQNYGGMVLETNEPLSIRSDYTRSSEEETYALIISDLEAAIPALETNPETGRFSKRAAQHLLAEVYLTRAYTSFAASDDFNTAAALAEEAIGSYDIRSQSFAQVFDISNQENDEVLFAVQWGTGATPEDQGNNKHALFMNEVFEYPGINRISTPYGVSGYSAMPTPYFYSLFADNDTREDATIHRVLYADGDDVFGTDNIVAGDTVVYYPKNALDPAELEDKLNRYYVYQPDQYLFGLPDNIPGTVYQYSSNPLRANFPIFKKFDDDNFQEQFDGSRDTFIYRVAGTHLIAAEAYLGAGNTTQALAHINRVRERATGVANEYTSVTIDDILNERALELAGEVNRWVALKRTGKLEERVNLYNPHVVDHGTFSSNTHLVRPIPAQELLLSDGSLEQNPNY